MFTVVVSIFVVIVKAVDVDLEDQVIDEAMDKYKYEVVDEDKYEVKDEAAFIRSLEEKIHFRTSLIA